MSDPITSATIRNFITNNNFLYVSGLTTGTSFTLSTPTFLSGKSSNFALSMGSGVTLSSISYSTTNSSTTLCTISYQVGNAASTSSYSLVLPPNPSDNATASFILNSDGTYTVTSLSGSGAKGSGLIYYVPSNAVVSFYFTLTSGAKNHEMKIKSLSSSGINPSSKVTLPASNSYYFTTTNPAGTFSLTTSNGVINDPTVVSEPNNGGSDYPDSEPSEKSR